ncbi:MAG: YigZ family protein [Candidatus Krumholzibacteriia bacterium]
MASAPRHDPPAGPSPDDRLVTLAGRGTAELKVQRSRFLAWAEPAAGEDEARAAVAEAARLHHDARHVCWAWRLGHRPQPLENRSDAGEPSGTAGEPILAALRRARLVDCVGIVMRWFGGVKLGTGGLARAYGEAMDAALVAAPRREIVLGRRFALRFPYALHKTLLRQLEGRGGRVVAEAWGADVAWTVWLPRTLAAGYLEAVVEASGGTVNPELLPGDAES